MARHVVVAVALLVTALAFPAEAMRVRDLGQWAGIRPNQLRGNGLVIGLAGTGDGKRSLHMVQSLVSMLARDGIAVDAKDIRVRNVASVMVTATLPPFARSGAAIDVTVASMGDAKSLQGGILLMCALRDARGAPRAVAQGPVVVGGYTAGASGTTVTKNHPTVGRVPNGAIVEQGAPLDLTKREKLVFQLSHLDFATAKRVAEAMQGSLGAGDERVRVVDGATVEVGVPEPERARVPHLIAQLEALDVEAEMAARVVIHEQTGTLVFGADVRVATVAVSHGNLRVEITTSRDVSQPAALSGGATTVVEQSRVEVQEEDGRLHVIEGGTSLGDLVAALNALGATPRDLLSILEAIKTAGALHAELVVQ